MATAETTAADEPVAVEEYADLRKLLLGHLITDMVADSGAQTITPDKLSGFDAGILATLRHFDILDRKPDIERPAEEPATNGNRRKVRARPIEEDPGV